MKIVVALGGNALGIDPQEQKENAYKTCQSIAKVILDGNELVLTHGNGPQVGLINLAFEHEYENKVNNFNMPFAECSAMSQGYIAHHIANNLGNILTDLGSDKKVVNVLTHVLVDKDDKAFSNPTKPIGKFYTKEETIGLNFPVKEVLKDKYRRVIASPKPQDILEQEAIEDLIQKGFVVISCGGGGIPVYKDNNHIIGIDAVIDKDLASSLLAAKIKADVLLIITGIEAAKINFQKDNEQTLGKISYFEAKKHLDNGEFLAGSMKPKIEACLDFLDNNHQGVAIITDIEHISEALEQKKGTIIYYE